MKLFTLSEVGLAEGMLISMQDLGYNKIPVIDVGGDKAIKVTKPYPGKLSVFYGHIFLNSKGEIGLIPLPKALSNESALVLFSSNEVVMAGQCLISGSRGSVCEVQIDEIFGFQNQLYVFDGTNIMKIKKEKQR
jgi:hypothetical protein